LAAIHEVLSLENSVNGSLLALYKAAHVLYDPHLYNLLESNFFKEQIGGHQEIGKLKKALIE